MISHVVFLAHWSLAYIEEQFYALYTNLKNGLERRGVKSIYFCHWHDRRLVRQLFDLFVTIGDDCEDSRAIDFANYPSNAIVGEQQTVDLDECSADNTLFIVHFNPRHLTFFLQSNGHVFPAHYCWWQIEQASNSSFFQNSLYRDVLLRAKAHLQFSRTNVLEFYAGRTFYTPFSRTGLLYDESDSFTQLRLQNICNHQKQRLLQDNRAFRRHGFDTFQEMGVAAATKKVLLLGTCQPRRRAEFVRHCKRLGVTVVHPFEHNYLFGLERQDFIRQCRVAVNIHQYKHSCLEQAKLFLLIENGCQRILSEKSVSDIETQLVRLACKGYVEMHDTPQRIATVLAKDVRTDSRRKTSAEKIAQPRWFSTHFDNVAHSLVHM